MIEDYASHKRSQRESAKYRDGEAQAMATKLQCPQFKEKEAQAMATKRQCPEFRDNERQHPLHLPVSVAIG